MENRNLNDGTYRCKDIISCMYIWDYMTIEQKNQILNDSKVIDSLSKTYNELADLIDKFSKSKWKDLPKTLKSELKNFGYDEKLYKEFLTKYGIYTNGKRDIIEIIKRISKNA